MTEAGDFFPDDGIGLVSEGVNAAMPSSDLRDDGVLATSKVKRSLRRSRAGCQAFLTKLNREMEFLLVDKRNERVHTVFLESLDDTAEIQRTSECESRLKEKFEFFQRVDQWIASSQVAQP